MTGQRGSAEGSGGASPRVGTAGGSGGSPPRVGADVPDLLYGEAESQLRAAVRSLLDDRCSAGEVLARTESPETYDTGLWHVLAADLGCAGLLVPEQHGGAGAGYREAAVVAEETGRAVAPVPYLDSAVVATTALLAAGDGELMTALAGGRATAALAVPFAAAPRSVPAPAVRLGPPLPGDPPGTGRLSGTIAGVAGALPAGVLLVPADGVPRGLYAVEVRQGGVSVTPVVSLDMTRQLCDITLEEASGRLLASGEAADRAVANAVLAGAGILASELLGTAERCLEITVAYLKERRQFARPVGSFQALKHRAADLWVAVTQARAAARYAAARLTSGDPDTPVAVALAKAACSDAAVAAAEECVQLHGGIGFTWEHPAHLYLKRAKSASIGFGTADRHRASLTVLANLPAPAAERAR